MLGRISLYLTEQQYTCVPRCNHEFASFSYEHSREGQVEDYRNRALITFSYDDGKRNNYEVALPIHEKYDINPCFAIIANRAISPRHWHAHMSPWQISDSSRRGVEINSHGVMHQHKFTDLDHDELQFELLESKRILQGFVEDQEVNTLCLPFSASNEEVRLRASEYYTTVRGHGGQLNDQTSNATFVTSHGLKNFTTFNDIKLRIDDAVRQKKWLVLMLHGVVNEDYTDNKYDVSKDLLEEILQYVNDLGSEIIKPVTFGEMQDLRQEEPPPKHFYTPDIQEPGPYTLADAPGYLITYHKSRQNTDKVVISFGGLPSKKTSRGFGSTFLLKQGYDHIFVAQEEGSQYQELPLTDFVTSIEPYIENKQVFTYGSSLGAYAALYYGGAVNAKIIASAPKNSAHRFMRKRKYSHIKFKHDDLEDAPLSNVSPLVLFDPFREEETNFIENWVKPAYPGAYLMRFPFAGHTVLNTMQQSGGLKDFIKSYIEENRIIEPKLSQQDSYIWHAEKGRRFLRQGHLDGAKYHYRQSLELQQNGEAAAGLARILLQEKNPREAQEVVTRHFESTGGHKSVPEGLRKSIQKRLQ